MVCNDLDSHVFLWVFAVFDADKLAGFVHDGAEQVRLKIVFDALDH